MWVGRYQHQNRSVVDVVSPESQQSTKPTANGYFGLSQADVRGSCDLPLLAYKCAPRHTTPRRKLADRTRVECRVPGGGRGLLWRKSGMVPAQQPPLCTTEPPLSSTFPAWPGQYSLSWASPCAASFGSQTLFTSLRAFHHGQRKGWVADRVFWCALSLCAVASSGKRVGIWLGFGGKV